MLGAINAYTWHWCPYVDEPSNFLANRAPGLVPRRYKPGKSVNNPFRCRWPQPSLFPLRPVHQRTHQQQNCSSRISLSQLLLLHGAAAAWGWPFKTAADSALGWL